MIAALSQESLRSYVIGSNNVPSWYIPAWAITESIGRTYRHVDRIHTITSFSLLTVFGDADTLCLPHASTRQYSLGEPRSDARARFQEIVQSRLQNLMLVAEDLRHDLHAKEHEK